MSVKVNTRELNRQLNNLNLNNLTYLELEELIKNNVQVVEIGNSTERRLYVSLKGE